MHGLSMAFAAFCQRAFVKRFDIELFLKLGPDAYEEKVSKMGYSILWPKITIPDRSGNPSVDEETDAAGIEELDASTNGHSMPTEWLHREFSTFELR
jgi:hypothetical protein